MIGSAFLRASQCERRAKTQICVCKPIRSARAACCVAHLLRLLPRAGVFPPPEALGRRRVGRSFSTSDSAPIHSPGPPGSRSKESSVTLAWRPVAAARRRPTPGKPAAGICRKPLDALDWRG